MKKNILLLSPFFSPDIGGVSTHLDDLVVALIRQHYNLTVLTFRPLGRGAVNYLPTEKKSHLLIRRFWWFAGNLFDRLEDYPPLEFLYLCPYYTLRSLAFLFTHRPKIDTIHAHGLSAAFVGLIVKKIFGYRLVVSTHAIYAPQSSLVKFFVRLILNRSDQVICLSQKSLAQLSRYGVHPSRLSLYHYWINTNVFKTAPLPKNQRFTVLYVGRIIYKKGIKVLCRLARRLPQIDFHFVGSGIHQDYLIAQSKVLSNIKYFGYLDNYDTVKFYQQSHILCIPSQYEEGYGRVVMESVACGTPVVASDLGSINEAIDNTVAIFCPPDLPHLQSAILKLSKSKLLYRQLQSNCRPFALKHFSAHNLKQITVHY